MAPTLEAKEEAHGTGEQTTDAIDTSAADFLLAVISDYTTPIPGNFSDSKGNSWTWLTRYGGGTNSFNVRIAYCNDPIVGSGHTVTYTAAYHVTFFYAFSDMDGWLFDTENGCNECTNTGEITPDTANEFLVTAACGTSGSCDSSTVSGGFALEDQVAYNSGVNPGGAVAFDLVYPSTDPVSCDWTDVAEGNNALTIAAFQAPEEEEAPAPMLALLGVGG